MIEMDTTKIASITNPKTGEVTLYLKDTYGGPVVTGKNMTDALLRWQESFMLFNIACAFMR